MRRQLSDYDDVDHPSVPDHCAVCEVELTEDERDVCARCERDRFEARAHDEADLVDSHEMGSDAFVLPKDR